MSVVVKGVNELVEKLRSLKAASNEITGQSLLAGAFVLEGQIKLSMRNTPRGGKTSRRGRKTHTSSTPGSPPAIDYGALENSIASERDGNGAVVYTDKDYSAHLEFGTARMAARPFMRPAADDPAPEMFAVIQATARRLIDAAAK